MNGSGTKPNLVRVKSKEPREELRAKYKELGARISEYRRQGEFNEAIASLRCALRERSYPDRIILEHLAELYADTGQFELAVDAARRLIELGDASPRTELHVAILQARAGNNSLARDIFAKVAATNPELHQAQFEYGCFLCERGELGQGATLIDRAIELALDADQYRRRGAKRLFSAAKGFWDAGERTKAIASAQKAADLAPEHIPYHLGLAEFRCRSGDQLGAISGLKLVADKALDPGLQPADAKDLVTMAAILQRGGELNAAWKILERVAPDHQRAQRLRYIIKYFQGDVVGARREALAYLKLLKSPMLRLPLSELFDECLRQAQADDQEPELARWLWPSFNLPASSRQDWLLRLRWGLRVNKHMLLWIPANRERLDELDDLVDPPDWSLLAAARTEGKPIILTGLHLGPHFVAAHYIDRLNHPVLMVAGDLIYPLTVGSKPFVSDAVPHTVLQLRDCLARFGTVYLAGGGRDGRSRYPVKFLGSTVFLREGVAILARLAQAQTFVCAARWVGHRIKLDLIQGPTALKDESREAWNERWFSFYMTQLERHLLAGPENVRKNSFWFMDRQ